jgi:hypothetical protein
VWSFEYGEYISGGLAFSKNSVLELAQFDSVLVGRMGGTITSCLSGFGCFTDILYNTYVSGRVTSDSVVVLQWIEDSTQVGVQGRVGPGGLSGATQGSWWEAIRETPVGVGQAKQLTGDTLIVRGVVTVSAGKFEGGTLYPGNVVYVQDGSGGIEVVGLFTSVPIRIGDSVLVRGVSSEDGYGERAVVPIHVSFGGVDPRPPELVRLGLGAIPSARVVTVANVAARTYEGSVVSLRGVRLASKPSAASGGYVLTFADSANATFRVIVHSTIATTVTLGSWTVGSVYDITGIQGSSNGTPNVQIRGSGDRVLR